MMLGIALLLVLQDPVKDAIAEVGRTYKALNLPQDVRRQYKEPLTRLLTGGEDTLSFLEECPVETKPDYDAIAAHLDSLRAFCDVVEGELELLEPPPPEPELPATWVLRPDRYTNIATNQAVLTSQPIVDVYGADHWSSSGKNRPEVKAPGDVLELEPGEYQHFRITQSYDRKDGVQTTRSWDDVEPGRDPQTVIRARVPGTVIITPNPVGGSHTCYEEWAGAVTMIGLTFLGDDLTAVQTENPYSDRFSFHQGFRDLRFYDCSILGGWDAEQDTGPKNKWGVLNYAVGESARGMPGWIWSGGMIEGIFEEHANYFHNVQGDILLENMVIRWCGRTAFQMANRTGEGPAGFGNLTFRNLTVEDVCLQDGGGGSAFSFNGRHTGTILLEGVTVRLGANPNLAAPRNRNITGALVVHAGEQTNNLPNGDVIVQDCDFQVGPAFVGVSSARRGNIQVDECQSFTLRRTRVAQMTMGAREALDIETAKIVGLLTLDADNVVLGDCILDGRTFADLDLDGNGVPDGAAYRNMLAALEGRADVVIER